MLAHLVGLEGQEEARVAAVAAAAAVATAVAAKLHSMCGKDRSTKNSNQRWCPRWRRGDCGRRQLSKLSIQLSAHALLQNE